MPYKQKNSPHWWINKQFKGIGRIQKSTETSNRRIAIAMEVLLDRLYKSGKGVFIEELKRGDISLPWLYTKDLSGELEETTSSSKMHKVSDIIIWVDEHPDYAEDTKRSYKSLAKKIDQLYPNRNVSELPAILRDFRLKCLKPESKLTRGFNQTRTLLQAYTAQIDGRYKSLWTDITNVSPIKYKLDTGKMTFPHALVHS